MLVADNGALADEAVDALQKILMGRMFGKDAWIS